MDTGQSSPFSINPDTTLAESTVAARPVLIIVAMASFEVSSMTISRLSGTIPQPARAVSKLARVPDPFPAGPTAFL